MVYPLTQAYPDYDREETAQRVSFQLLVVIIIIIIIFI